MRIAVLTSVGTTLDAFFPELVEQWQSLGSTVVTGASTPSSVGSFTQLRSVSRRPSIRNLAAPAEIRRWIIETGADVLLTNTATASALARLRQPPVPIVYFCHGLHWNEGRSVTDKIWQLVERSLLSRTQGVITINSDDEAWFNARMEADKALRLPRGVGVPLERYPMAAMPSGPRVKLLWAGEFSSRKQPSQAVEVLRLLRAGGHDVHLEMLGDGPLREETMRVVAGSGLSEHISLPGRGDFPSRMRAASALVHTAKWEGLPRVMLEAYAMGRRSYAYNVKGVRDIPGASLAADSDPSGLAGLIGGDILSGRIGRVSVSLDGLQSSAPAGLIHQFLTTVAEPSTVRGVKK